MIDGHSFDSKKESKRYEKLKEMQQAGLISGLRLQVSFKLEVSGHLICRYRADFAYVQGNRRIIEDVKGMKTPVYELKRKLMLAIHGIEIRET